MATYKLIQDIEAEDHILGPLSLRQFIFGLIAAFIWYLCFIITIKHIYFLLVLFVPPALFFTFFAVPFGRDQPTEVWALAKLRFWFKPRKRLWDQSGMKEMVTITVPKKVEHVLTNGLSQNEVQSRLGALANTLDTRGWAVKNAALGGGYAQPNPLLVNDTDRLVSIANAPTEVPNYDVRASDDILDETSNPVAQQFATMIDRSSQQHHQQLIDRMNSGATGQPQSQAQPAMDYWFMNQSAANTMPQQVALPGAGPLTASIPAAADPTQEEMALAARVMAQNSAQPATNSHLRTLQPLGSQPMAMTPTHVQVDPSVTPASPMKSSPDPAILSLANNDDLNVSTLARQAYKAKHNKGASPDDEVVISLR